MNKSKIIMAITIGIMSFIMIYVMSIQFKTVSKGDSDELEYMRETELKEMLASYKGKYEETVEELNGVKDKINEYTQDEKSEEEAFELLKNEVKEANMLLGKTDVKGEGVIITINSETSFDSSNSNNTTIIDDVEQVEITHEDLLDLVNELKLAGAEAIEINGERVITTTDIFDVGNFILINGQRTKAPYTIKAIGNQSYLESALSVKDGYIDEYRSRGYNVTISKEKEIVIKKYEGEMTLKYVK